MKKRQFIQILRKYQQGTATNEEREFIESYYDLFETAPGLKAEGSETEELKKGMLDGIWERIQSQHPVYGKTRIRKLTAYRVRIAAAVLILLASGSMLYIGIRKTGNKEAVAENTPQSDENAIHPGGNKAILTLANGKQVVLNSMQDGSLARQGSTQIIKLDSGRLAYKSAQAGKPGDQQILYNTITTPRGGQYQVVLPDGSKVWLNAASSLHFPTAFTGNEREVEVSGEAYFEIVKRPGSPFIVKTGEVRIQVLGTHFDVEAYPDEHAIKTTVAEGAVKVLSRQESRLLRSGEQAGWNELTEKINVHPVNMDEVLAWKNGLFYFDNANIEAIMRKVARWYDVDVVYHTEELANKNYSGVLSRYSDVHALLKRLELTGTVHFNIEGKSIIVMN